MATEYLALVVRALEAARAGDADMVDRAVRAGVGVNSTSPHGDSLLMLSASHGHAAAVGVLLDLGADPGWRDPSGLRAVDRARAVGAADVVEVFERRGLA